MLEMNSKTLRFFSRMGARGVLGQIVFDYLQEGNALYVVTADLSRASGFDRVKKMYPEHLVNVGIAEQNMIGVSAGLASQGTPVIATTWATFSSVRAADQIRNYMGFMHSNIKLVGLESGLSGAEYGYTHSNCPDIAVIRSIPGIKILCPCDGSEIYQAVYAALKYDGPVYIRLVGRPNLPAIYTDPAFEYKIGSANILRKGSDAVIISAGTILNNALQAAEKLSEEGISVEVIDMHTIVPLDTAIIDHCLSHNLIFVLEDHLITGGLYSAVCEYICALPGNTKPRIAPISIKNGFIPSGTQEFTEKLCGIDTDTIIDVINREVSL